MKTNKVLMKEMKDFFDLTKGNDKFHTITIKFKTFKYDSRTGAKIDEKWSTLNTVFSAPVLRAFFRFSTTFERNVIIYDFRKYGSNNRTHLL